MFSEISLPVPSQQMMMLRMVMLPDTTGASIARLWGFWMTVRMTALLVHCLPDDARSRQAASVTARISRCTPVSSCNASGPWRGTLSWRP